MKIIAIIFLYAFIFFYQTNPCFSDSESDAYYDSAVKLKLATDYMREQEEEELRKAEMRVYDQAHGGSKCGNGGWIFILIILGYGVLSAIITEGDKKAKNKVEQDKNARVYDEKIMNSDELEIKISNAAFKGFIIDNEKRRCVSCAEQINLTSMKCIHCGKEFTKGYVDNELKDRVFEFLISMKKVAHT